MKTPYIENLLTNPIARSKKKVAVVSGIVLHWPAKPEQRARDVIKYWENEKNKVGSAHGVIDFDGTLYLAIPLDEKAYHVGSSDKDPASGKIYTDLARELFGKYAEDPVNLSPNCCTLGFEMVHKDWDGHFTADTIETAACICAELCLEHKLSPLKRIVTHQQVVGWKNCPKWFVDNPKEFEAFKEYVRDKIVDSGSRELNDHSNIFGFKAT